MTNVNGLQPEQLAQMIRENKELHVIDVRTPMEFQEVHLTMARNIPLDQLRIESLPNDGKPIVFVCKSGTRGRMACEKALGKLENIHNLEGGTMACVDAGLPVVRGRKVMSLERQVRIAAGSLVLAGVGLSFLHPYGIGLSAFIGAGLVFAGITDTCGMGMMLAKMPWNQLPKSSASPTSTCPTN